MILLQLELVIIYRDNFPVSLHWKYEIVGRIFFKEEAVIFAFTFKNAEVRKSFFSPDSSESFISPKVKLKPSFFPFTVTDFVSFFAVSYYNRGKPGLP